MNENRLWEPTEKGLAPQEKVLMIKQEVLKIVKDFLERDPRKITAEELITATTNVNSHRSLAEKSGDMGLPKYLEDAVEKMRDHKNSGNSNQIGLASDNYKKRKIGTHGRFAEQ